MNKKIEKRAGLQSDQLNIAELEGVIPSIAKALASIATLDNIVTVDEYAVISDASELLAKNSDSPLMVSTSVLHYLLHPADYRDSLKTLAKNLRGESGQVKALAFTVLSEVASLQSSGEKIQDDIAHALELNTNHMSSQTVDIFDSLSNAIFSRFKSKATRTENIRRFAQTFGDKDLLLSIDEVTKDVDIPEEAETLLITSKTSAQNALAALRDQHPEISETGNPNIELGIMTNLLVEQVQNRLSWISKRIDLERDLFIESFQDLIDDIGLEFDAATKDRVRSSDYTRTDIWADFIKTEGGRIVKARYDKMKSRHERSIRHWQSEYESFADELDITQKSVMSNYSRREFQTIMPETSTYFGVLGRADTLSSGVVDVAATGGLAAAIATGAGYGGVVLSAVTNPVGLGLLGVVGVAGLYQWLSEPEGRINNEVSRLTSKLQQNLNFMLGDPIGEHQKIADEIEQKFYLAADEKFRPIIINSKLVTLHTAYKAKVIRKVTETTTRFIEEI